MYDAWHHICVHLYVALGGEHCGIQGKEPATGQFLSEKMAENSLVYSIATRENEEASCASSSEMDVELVDKG